MTRAELIAALEKATGPSIMLEQEISVWRYAQAGLPAPDVPKPYTSSIDAALMLVEDGLLLEIERAPNGDWRVWITLNEDEQWFGAGKSAAIALCIAALKAMEANNEGH